MLNRTFGCVRLVWNKALAERSRRYRSEGKSTSYRETDAALTAWKRTDDLSFLAEVSCVPLQQTLRHQHAAYRNFFAGHARFPRFKSRSGRQSAHFTRSAFRLRAGELQLAKTSGPIRLVWSFDQVDLATLSPSMVIVTRETDHRWYVTFTVDSDDPEPLAANGHSVGLDLGVKDFAVTSDGRRIANPTCLQRKARALARYQRRLARARRGSSNRAKAKRKIAAAHRKVCNARRDFLHRTSTRIVRDADVIVIEDLAVANMVRNRRLSRAISDVAWGEFRAMLEYKAHRAGRTLVAVDRWYPSTRTCSTCGHLLSELGLSIRHWTCPNCRTRHDRDLNAAKNILAAGRVVARGDSGDACGADVRRQGLAPPLSAAKQESRAVRHA